MRVGIEIAEWGWWMVIPEPSVAPLCDQPTIMLRQLYYRLTPRQRLLARKLVYLPADLYHRLFGKAQSDQRPPRGDIYVGPGDFVAIGNNQVTQLRQYLDLQPTDAVLDIGSGIGRTALPLTRYLSDAGSYEGFDVVEKGVEWCRKHITAEHPNFRFTYVALGNDLYNDSTRRASEFTFPYGDGSFDAAFLFSVFTHLSVAEIGHYLTEIDRVLRPDGKCLATFFLYNDSNAALISTQAGFQFPHQRDGYRLLDERVTSANIALERKYPGHFAARHRPRHPPPHRGVLEAARGQNGRE